MSIRFPFLKRYLVYLCATIILGILLVAYIYRTGSWTGDKPFSEFVQNDWNSFFIFFFEEVIIAAIMFLFVGLVGKICKKEIRKLLNSRI